VESALQQAQHGWLNVELACELSLLAWAAELVMHHGQVLDVHAGTAGASLGAYTGHAAAAQGCLVPQQCVCGGGGAVTASVWAVGPATIFVPAHTGCPVATVSPVGAVMFCAGCCGGCATQGLSVALEGNLTVCVLLLSACASAFMLACSYNYHAVCAGVH
jgi:hypothetical protein